MTILALATFVGIGSFAAGLLGSLTGLGGGIIVVPMLIYVFHVDFRYAVGASLVSIIAIVEVMRRARTVTATSGNPFTGGGTEAPILEVFLFVGLLFIIFNYALSRLSRRLEIREKERTGSKPDIEVRGLEEQVA